MLAALFCGVVGLWVPGALGLGLDVIPDFLTNNLPIAAVVILVITKLVLTGPRLRHAGDRYRL